MIGVDSLIKFADKLGIIKAVKDKLIKRPDPASDKLITALEEIVKSNKGTGENLPSLVGS
ncbi:hypothetical protein ACFLQP_03020 [Acidobacteriota bacterium]